MSTQFPSSPAAKLGSAWLFCLLLGLWLLLLALFHDIPAIDISVARWFFTQMTCGSDAASGTTCGLFFWNRQPVLKLLRMALFWLPVILALGCLAAGLFLSAKGGTAEMRLLGHRALILFGTWFLAVLVVVNLVLKSWSGRPRPVMTDLFGGDLPFVPAGVFSSYCSSNCSFISGEGASAGWLICLVFLLPPATRRPAALILSLLSLMTLALRIGFGGHYLSDAVLGWLAALVIFALLCAVFQWSPPTRGR